MSFFLTGSFNGWRPNDPAFRFEEVTDPYHGQRPDLTVSFGSFSLTCRLPRERIQFKIVEDGSWDRQWSVGRSMGRAGDDELNVEKYRFHMRHGLNACYFIYCGSGDPTHSEYVSHGETERWDFHPESRTLCIHRELDRTAGMRVFPWERFDCGDGLWFETWVCLPYGYSPNHPRQYASSLFFDGPGLIYGEDGNFNIWNQPARQWPWAVDVLSRHGVVTPTVVVGVGVPHIGSHYRRAEAYLYHDSSIHQRYVRSIVEDLIPTANAAFRLSDDPLLRSVVGHSNGGDMALRMVTHRPELFGGAVAISPGGAHQGLRLPKSARSRARIACTYASEDLRATFVTQSASARIDYEAAGINHLTQFVPNATHDPASVYPHLFAPFGYVLR